MPKVIALAGPTAVGKTALSIALAQQLDAEIVGCDSMQVYRHARHLSAAPTEAEQAAVPHHLFGFVDPAQAFNAGLYYKTAYPLINSILNRGKSVIIVGGTGLYLKTLYEGICEAPPANAGVRRELEQAFDNEGPDKTHAKLAAVDPDAAAKLHPHDRKRIVRALEVYELTGKPLSVHWREQNATNRPGIAMTRITLNRDRAELYERIERRNIEMLYNRHVLQELENLLQSELSSTAERIHGVLDMRPFFDGVEPFGECVARWQQRIRNYSKQQLTWFRNAPDFVEVNLSEVGSIHAALDQILELSHGS